MHPSELIGEAESGQQVGPVRLLFRKAKSVAKQLRRIGYVVKIEVRIHQQVEHSRLVSVDRRRISTVS